jgi:hypothetical protein
LDFEETRVLANFAATKPKQILAWRMFVKQVIDRKLCKSLFHLFANAGLLEAVGSSA